MLLIIARLVTKPSRFPNLVKQHGVEPANQHGNKTDKIQKKKLNPFKTIRTMCVRTKVEEWKWRGDASNPE